MKQFVFIFSLIFSLSVFSQEADLKWSQNFEETLIQAKKNKKPIIMYFSGSDWCAPCKTLDADFFHSEKFLKKANEVNLVLVDIPRRVDIISAEQMKINKELLKKYNSSKSFPKVIYMNYKGRVKEEIKGYSFLRDTSKHFEYLNNLLD